jgi:hypothetical protein
LENPVTITSSYNQRLRAFPSEKTNGIVDFVDLDQDWEKFEIIPSENGLALRSYYHKNHIGANAEHVFSTNIRDRWELWELQKLANEKYLIRNLEHNVYLSSPERDVVKMKTGPPGATEEFIITKKVSCVYSIERGFYGAQEFCKPIKIGKKGFHSALLLQKGSIFSIIEYGADDAKNEVRTKDLREDNVNVKSWDKCLYDGKYYWRKSVSCVSVQQEISAIDVAETMRKIMSISRYDLEDHNSHVAQESVRYFYGWAPLSVLDYKDRVARYVETYRESIPPKKCNLVRKIQYSDQLKEISYFALYHSEKNRYLSADGDGNTTTLPLKTWCGEKEVFFFDKRDAKWGIVSDRYNSWVSRAFEDYDWLHGRFDRKKPAEAYQLSNGFTAIDAGLVNVRTAKETAGDAKWDASSKGNGFCLKNGNPGWYLSATYSDKARIMASCLGDEIWEIWEVKKSDEYTP